MTVEKFMELFMEKSVAVATSLIILIVTVFVVKISKSLIHNFFTKKLTKPLRFDERKSKTMESVSYSVVKYTVYFFSICTILSVFGIPVSSLIAVAGVGSIAVGFGAQSIVKDIFAGFFIILEDQFGIGDIVTIEGRSGTVENINMRTTCLRGFDGTLHIIPNGTINIIDNMTKGFMCAIVNVDIAYGEDIEKVIDMLKADMLNCFEEISGFHEVPNVLGVVNMANWGVTIRIVAECEVKENYRIERELKLRIKNLLDNSNIRIPSPQSTIQIAKED